MTYDLNEIERVVRYHLHSYRDDPRFEDAVQEAMIRAWKDIESGEMESFHHVCNRAKIWGRGWIQKKYSRVTGSPALSREGRKQNVEQVQAKTYKIDSWVKEFWSLHERRPTITEVSQGTGIPWGTVRIYLKNIREGNVDHAVYDQEGSRRRIASSYFDTTSIELDSFERSSIVSEASFEDNSIASIDFQRLIRNLPENLGQFAHLVYGMGHTQKDAADILGITTKVAYTWNLKVLEKVKILWELADAELPTCRNGHEKTEENTLTYPSGERRCAQCLKAHQAKRNAQVSEKRRKARQQQTHCQRNHEITGVRKNGSRYCKVCNELSNKKRAAPIPERGYKALTDDEVRAIRRDYKKTQKSSNVLELAVQYQVSKATIYNIIKGTRYKDVK